MCLSVSWSGFLEANGYEAAHWSKIGRPDEKDKVILSWAVKHDAVILTKDLDFAMLVFQKNLDRPSIVQIRSEEDLPGGAGPQVLRALSFLADDLRRGAVVTIAAGKTRATLIPFRTETDEGWEDIPQESWGAAPTLDPDGRTHELSTGSCRSRRRTG
jgi:predicted nuclease of predicted toxin-antitoxin system